VVAAAHSIVPAQFQEAVVRRLPLTRTGTVGDTASGLFFLLSDASRWLTGHVAGVDGGQVVRL
jgi:NAD(P)-dependent dehydrogenase (short-subunit alcohol dehydrogenase family)